MIVDQVKDLPVFETSTSDRSVAERHAAWEASRTHVTSSGFQRLYQTRLKRVLDFVFGTLILLCAFPIIALAWLAVRLTSAGPGLFAQQRIGLNGNLFTVYKLRSMHINQDRLVDISKVREGEAQGILYKPEDDPRVTTVGKIIRKTSIDELPQLWNVVRGDMSLVGPRPLVAYMLDPHPEVKKFRCKVRPGITGEWQVENREDNTSIAGMVRHDFHYIKHYSLSMDLRILLRTVGVVLGAKGAH